MDLQVPRAVGLADVHLTNSHPHARPLPGTSGLTDRFQQQLEAIGRAAAKAVEIGGPVIVFGDFFDRASLDPITLTETMRLMIGSGAAWWILPGNHDANSLSGGRFNVEMFREMKHPRVKLLELGESVMIGDWCLHPLPYGTIAANRKQLQDLRIQVSDWRKRQPTWKHCLCMHNSIIGCKVEGDWISDHGLTPGEVCKGFDAVIAGHFHTEQKFGPCGRYLGAPMQFRTSDAGEDRGGWVISFGESLGFERLDLGAPRFIIVNELSEAKDARPHDIVICKVQSTAAEKDRAMEVAQRGGDEIVARVISKHVTTYQHDARAAGLDELAKHPAEFVSMYVDHDSVKLGELDRGALKVLGADIVRAAGVANAQNSGGALVTGMQVRDLLVFREAKIDFDRQGLMFVQGRNEDSDGASSNGSGKSSIYKALTWILYGQAIDDETSDGFIRQGATSAWGQVEIIAAGEEWTIIRERSKGSPKLTLIAPDGSEFNGNRKGAQEQIDALMGFGFDVWRSIVTYGRSDPTSFSSPWASDADRKKLLHAILGTGYFSACAAEVMKRSKDLEERRQHAKSELKVIDARLADCNVAEEQRKAASWEKTRTKRVADLEAKLTKLEQQPAPVLPPPLDLEPLRSELEAAEEIVTRGPDDIDASLLAAKQRLEEEAAKLARKLPGASEIAALEKTATIARSARAKLEAQIERVIEDLSNLSADTCPTCGQKVCNEDYPKQVASLTAKKTDLEEKMRKAKKEVADATNRLADMKQRKSEAETAQRQAASAATKVAEAEKVAAAKISAAQGKIATITKKLAEAEKAASQAASLLAAAQSKRQAEIDGVRAQIVAVREEKNPLEIGVAQAQEKRERLQKQRSKWITANAELAEEASHLEFWAFGFSPQGLPSMLLDAAMPVLTERANHYLEILADGDISGCISTQKELRSKKDEVRDRISLRWTIEGAEGVTPSDGQRTKIRVAVDLAMMDLAAARGLTSNLLLFDEILDGLDRVGTERMLSLLYALRASKPSIFVISHETGMSEDFEGGLIVVKKNGAATVERT